MIDIKDVFSAQPECIWKYLCEAGQGMYIPAYQRQYSWDKAKISRLIEDMCHGYTILVKQEDSITFLGTIIAIHDTTYSTINPLVKGEIPSKVMTVIDGQQRLTTLLLLITVLHDEIRIRLNKLSNKEEVAVDWLSRECKKILGRLSKTYEEDKDYYNGHDENFKFYPKMIRAYEDSWSRDEKSAQYKSPIGLYLHKYGAHTRSTNSNTLFSFTKSVGNETKYKPLLEGRACLLELVRKIASPTFDYDEKNDDKEKLELPQDKDIFESRILQETLLKTEIPPEIAPYTQENLQYAELLHLVLFANFALDRVALTVVTAKNEDYAFDMFESLNTTGEPLTAFETFKPKIIYSEGLDKFEQSPAKQKLEAIENYLESNNKLKPELTSKLIMSFALSECGISISKRLNDQRRFLKDTYESIKYEDKYIELNKQREYVDHLYLTCQFIEHCWPDDKDTRVNFPQISATQENAEDIETAKLCLEVLRKMKHAITISPLARFYTQIYTCVADEKAQRIIEFISAVKATLAFSILWRSSRRNTAGIDGHYRKLMEIGSPQHALAPLSRSSKNSTTERINLRGYKEALLSILSEGGAGTKEKWLALALQQPIYKINKDIARFLLLAASHDSVPDTNPANYGLICKGKKGVLKLLDVQNWLDTNNQTVEHIAPQENTDWDDSLYSEGADKLHINKLGNLTLLPKPENSSISNQSWQKKLILYKMLSSKTEEETQALGLEAKNIGIKQSVDTIIQQAAFLPMIQALAQYDGEWNIEFVNKRTERISELAWDKISPWLE
ncbi:MAG: DUF262 domain-containing protein [Neisseriaceae bacterium]|nr:DUF262 domain-containing protein [Neisseriaceae bacterium]